MTGISRQEIDTLWTLPCLPLNGREANGKCTNVDVNVQKITDANDRKMWANEVKRTEKHIVNELNDGVTVQLSCFFFQNYGISNRNQSINIQWLSIDLIVFFFLFWRCRHTHWRRLFTTNNYWIRLLWTWNRQLIIIIFLFASKIHWFMVFKWGSLLTNNLEECETILSFKMGVIFSHWRR